MREFRIAERGRRKSWPPCWRNGGAGGAHGRRHGPSRRAQERVEEAGLVVDLRKVEGLAGIAKEKDGLRIGP